MAFQKTKQVHFSTSLTLMGSYRRKGILEYHESSYYLMNIHHMFLFFSILILSPQGPTWQSLSCFSLISAPLQRLTQVILSLINITINIVIIVIITINIIVVIITNNTITVTIVFIIIVIVVVVIIITRPKPPYGRQGLAVSWGKDTVRSVRYIIRCSQRLISRLRRSARIGYFFVFV